MKKPEEALPDPAVTWTHSMTLAPETINVVRARAFVVGCLTEHRLFSLIDPLRLVTSELVTNAILHAHTSVTVTLEQADDRVVMTVTDGSLAAPRRMPFDPLSVDGRGLILVDLLSADSGVTTDSADGTKSVWASFLVRGGSRVSEQRSGQEDVAQAVETTTRSYRVPRGGADDT